MSDDLPIVCTLHPGELNARAAELLPGLAARATSRQSIEGGCRLQFVATTDILQTIFEVIDAERQCCRFLRFTVTVDPDGGPISVDITGPAGTSTFLAALIDRA
jgi:hypothetical protein